MKKLIVLLFLATFAFSQESSFFKNVESDSVAYYEKEYQYHLEKYQHDENISKKAILVSGISLGIGGALGMFILVDDLRRKLDSDEGYTMSSPLVITAMSFLGISLVSVVVYASYGTIANMEKEDSDDYYNKKRDYEFRHATKISVVPLINPMEQKYGGILALNF